MAGIGLPSRPAIGPPCRSATSKNKPAKTLARVRVNQAPSGTLVSEEERYKAVNAGEERPRKHDLPWREPPDDQSHQRDHAGVEEGHEHDAHPVSIAECGGVPVHGGDENASEHEQPVQEGNVKLAVEGRGRVLATLTWGQYESFMIWLMSWKVAVMIAWLATMAANMPTTSVGYSIPGGAEIEERISCSPWGLRLRYAAWPT